MDVPALPTYVEDGGGDDDSSEALMEYVSPEARLYMLSIGVSVPLLATQPLAQRFSNDALAHPQHSDSHVRIVVGLAHAVPWVVIVPSDAQPDATIRTAITEALHGALADELDQWADTSQVSRLNRGERVSQPGALLGRALMLSEELYEVRMSAHRDVWGVCVLPFIHATRDTGHARPVPNLLLCGCWPGICAQSRTAVRRFDPSLKRQRDLWLSCLQERGTVPTAVELKQLRDEAVPFPQCVARDVNGELSFRGL